MSVDLADSLTKGEWEVIPAPTGRECDCGCGREGNGIYDGLAKACADLARWQAVTHGEHGRVD